MLEENHAVSDRHSLAALQRNRWTTATSTALSSSTRKRNGRDKAHHRRRFTGSGRRLLPSIHLTLKTLGICLVAHGLLGTTQQAHICLVNYSLFRGVITSKRHFVAHPSITMHKRAKPVGKWVSDMIVVLQVVITRMHDTDSDSTIEQRECAKCGYQWWPRAQRDTKRCPHCQSWKWREESRESS